MLIMSDRQIGKLLKLVLNRTIKSNIVFFDLLIIHLIP